MVKELQFRWIALASLWAVYCSTCSGQEQRTGISVTSTNTIVSETYGQDSIPDVNNNLSLVTILKNPQVARASGISPEATKQILKELRKNNGSFSVIFSEGGRMSGSDYELFKKDADAARRTREAWLDEFITPDQWKRLRQLAYQTEIARVGWSGALTSGRLGRDAGVTENQHTSIKNRVADIEAETQKKIQKLLAEAQEQILSELSTQQKAKAKELLGEPVLIQDEDPRNVYRP